MKRVTIGSSRYVMMSQEEISQSKKQLREHCRAIRKSLGVEIRTKASQSICEKIGNWDIFQQSLSILTYMPIKSEADLTSLLKLYPQKKWILPRIIPEDDHRMVFHPYDPNSLILHPFGMAEPDPDLPIVQPDEIELALVPGLAFDLHGFRLGYGGGYFDRFLVNFGGVSVGITFHTLLLDSISHEAHDISMQWVVTEHEFFRVQEKAGL